MITLNDILSSIDDIIIVKDIEGKIIYNSKDFSAFSAILTNNNVGEIYLEKKKKWFDLVNKSVVIGDGTYSLTVIKDITKYKMREKLLYDKGICDDLTGLYNRQGIFCGLTKLIENFKKSNKPFTVIIGDIDYFKVINDTYGHLAGDSILSDVGEILRKNTRENDFVGRYGGEEFLIILTTNNIPQIKKRVEQIRKEIEQHKFVYKDIDINLQMTFGIQLYKGNEQIEDVIDQADKALYYGKEHGRNQIILYDEVKNELNLNNRNNKKM